MQDYQESAYAEAQRPTTEQVDKQIMDFWGFQETRRFYLPDGIQYIEHKVLTEGDKARYQKATNRDLTISRNTGDAKLQADPAADRQALLRVAVTGWKMYRGIGPDGRPAEVPFSIGTLAPKVGRYEAQGGVFEEWLMQANPRIVEDLERDIRVANPWLLGDMSVEDIDREMENLSKMREVAVEREAGKNSSDDR